MESTGHPMDIPAEIDENPEIARARREGRRQAEAFESALRAVERQEREDRLTRIAWLGGDLVDLGEPLGGNGKSAQVTRLERQIEHYASFHHAVLHSRGWRLVQALRRLVGRAW